MIRNEREYKVSRAAAARFRTALTAAAAGDRGGRDPRLRRMTVDAMRAQLKQLDRDLATYDRIKRGEWELAPAPLEELGALLIQARLARGWTQRELGDRLGLHEQKIQDYEASGYARASLTRIRQVTSALGAEVTVALDLVPLIKVGTKKRRAVRS